MAIRVDLRGKHEEANRLIQELTERSETVRGDRKDECKRILTEYQTQVQASWDLPNPAQAERIEQLQEAAHARGEAGPRIVDLEAQVAALTLEKGDAISKLEELAGRHEVMEAEPRELRDAAEQRSQAIAQQIEDLQRELALAHKGLEGAGNASEPQIQEVIKQIDVLRKEKQSLEGRVTDLTEQAGGEAGKVAALQQELRRYQDVAREVATLPHDQVQHELAATETAHDDIEDTPQNLADKSFLSHKIGLLQQKHDEHKAIWQNALSSPEAQLQTQSALSHAFQAQAQAGNDILGTPTEEIEQKLVELQSQLDKITEQRTAIGDVDSQEAIVQLGALQLDCQRQALENQIGMLGFFQETLARFVEIGRAKAGESLGGVHAAVAAELTKERNALEGLEAAAEGKDEAAIAVTTAKIAILEGEAAKLEAAVQGYQEHSATVMLQNNLFLQGLVSLIPADVPDADKGTYLLHAVQAIAYMQSVLQRKFGADGVHHTLIKDLLNQIYTWNGQCLSAVDDSVAELCGDLFLEREVEQSLRSEPDIMIHEIVRYTKMTAEEVNEEVVAKSEELVRLNENLGRLEGDGATNPQDIHDVKVDLAKTGILLGILRGIQGQQQAVQEAHAAEVKGLNDQKGVLGTAQRLFFGLLWAILSVPRGLLRGARMAGGLFVSRPSR